MNLLQIHYVLAFSFTSAVGIALCLVIYIFLVLKTLKAWKLLLTVYLILNFLTSYFLLLKRPLAKCPLLVTMDEIYRVCYFDPQPVVKVKRAHHCSCCKRCVISLDHHCFFIGKCIGKGNLAYFFQFLYWAFLSSLSVSLTLRTAIFFLAKNKDAITHKPFAKLINLFINPIFALSVLCCVCSSLLLLLETYAVIKNKTLLEFKYKTLAANSERSETSTLFNDLKTARLFSVLTLLISSNFYHKSV